VRLGGWLYAHPVLPERISMCATGNQGHWVPRFGQTGAEVGADATRPENGEFHA
jgi:hypothetical protein